MPPPYNAKIQWMSLELGSVQVFLKYGFKRIGVRFRQIKRTVDAGYFFLKNSQMALVSRTAGRVI